MLLLLLLLLGLVHVIASLTSFWPTRKEVASEDKEKRINTHTTSSLVYNNITIDIPSLPSVSAFKFFFLVPFCLFFSFSGSYLEMNCALRKTLSMDMQCCAIIVLLDHSTRSQLPIYMLINDCLLLWYRMILCIPCLETISCRFLVKHNGLAYSVNWCSSFFFVLFFSTEMATAVRPGKKRPFFFSLK